MRECVRCICGRRIIPRWKLQESLNFDTDNEQYSIDIAQYSMMKICKATAKYIKASVNGLERKGM